LKKGYLVFASKIVGLELVRYLADRKAPLECVFVGSEDERELLDFLKANGIPGQIYSGPAMDELVRSGAGFEWILNFWSSHILSPAVLGLARHRLNTHPGLVPVSRGSFTASWMIRKNLKAGASLIEMAASVDAGGIYAEREVSVPYGMTGGELAEKLKQACIDLFREKWPEIESGRILPKPQRGRGRNWKARELQADRRLTGRKRMSADECVRWILAHDFSPSGTAELELNGRIYELILSVREKKGD